MLPDSIPSPKVAEPFEAQLRLLELGAAPASLDARMEALFNAPKVLAKHPSRDFWNRPLPWIAGVASLAACVLIVVSLGTYTAEPQPSSTLSVAKIPSFEKPVLAPTTSHAPVHVFEYAVPVGYQYQGSRPLYSQVKTLGSVHNEIPQQAYQRKTLMRHTFENPATHATFEVDEPQNELILENMQSY